MRKALVEMEAGPLRGHHRARRPLPPGPDGQHPGLLRPQARQGRAQQEALVPASQARADPARDLRHHRLPGAGDGGRARSWPAIRSAMPTFCAAPWARRSRPRWTPSASASSPAPSSGGARQGQRQRDLRPSGQIRRLRLQQEPRGRLCAGRLPDRLSEGQLSGRVPGGVDDARSRQHRQALRIPPRGAAARHQGRAALDQPLRAWFSTCYDARARPILYALAAIKGVGRQAIEALVEARGDKPFRDLADFARRINPRLLNKRTLENLIAAGAFDELEPDRARACASIDAMMSLAQQSHEAANGGMVDMFGGVAAADVQLRIPALRALARRRAPAAGIRRRRLLPVRPSARRIWRSAARSCGCRPGWNSAARSRPAIPSAASPRRCSTGRSAAPRPATRWESSPCRIRPGISRRSCSRKGLQRFRDILEPGSRRGAHAPGRCRGRGGEGAHRHGGASGGGGRQAPEGHADLPARRASDRQRATSGSRCGARARCPSC